MFQVTLVSRGRYWASICAAPLKQIPSCTGSELVGDTGLEAAAHIRLALGLDSKFSPDHPCEHPSYTSTQHRTHLRRNVSAMPKDAANGGQQGSVAIEYVRLLFCDNSGLRRCRYNAYIACGLHI